MFLGEFTATIDGQGRTSIPARFRDVLVEKHRDERVFITKCVVDLGNGEPCRGLSIYPYSAFLALAERLDQASGYTVAQLNSIKRLILAPAVECVADKQGRVLISPALRNYAALERELVMVGTQNKIEVWGEGTWSTVVNQSEKDYLAAAETLAVPGI
jgi:MraZ protein